MNNPLIDNKSALDENHSGTLLFTSIFNSCQDAIDFKSPNGIIRAWNPAAEKLYGYKAEEVIGKNVSILHSKENYPLFNEKLQDTINGRLQSRFETERITKSGEIITVILTLSPVVDLDGTLLGLSAISSDITQQKKSELRRLRLEKDREELLSIMANDVSNSLNQFDRLVEVFDFESNQTDQLRQVLKTLKCDNRRFLNTLENLILVYSLEKGRSLNFVPVNHEKEILKTKDELMCSTEKVLDVEVNLADHLEVMADYDLLSRLFKNILSWAITQSKPESAIEVKSELLESSKRVRTKVIFCANQFKQSDTECLFSSSWRTADGAETGGLSGLGLFLARQVAEAHEGSLNLTIKDDVNVFCLELPVNQKQASKLLELNRGS